MKYRVYYHMHMGWDVIVDADNEDEALEKADAQAELSEAKDYSFIEWERYADDVHPLE